MKRNGKFGEFYGCSAYPQCKYTQNIQPNVASTETERSAHAEPVNSAAKVSATVEQGQNRHRGPAESQNMTPTEYQCPRCKVGHFVKVEQRGRTAWQCSNSGSCRTTCADVNGKPSIYAGK